MAGGELWLNGPVPGVDPWLMPAAHALLQAHADLAEAAAGLTHDELWQRPGGAASVGFHLRHVAGATARLLTYARGESLTEEQRAAARAETDPPREGEDVESLLRALDVAVEDALRQIRATRTGVLLEPRGVGRQQLPSNVLGLVFHAAEHAQRHAGQAIATAKAVRNR